MINESEIRLLSEQKANLKTLSGYRKHHRMPEKGTVIADSFLAEIAENDLNEDLDNAFKKLRSEFGFKRKELSATDPIGNVGEVVTPGFTYEVSISTIEGESANVLWRRAISGIKSADAVTCPEFEATFGKQFNILQIQLKVPVDVEDVIDRVEDSEDPNIKIDYEKDASWCRIEFRGRKESIYVEADMIKVRSDAEISPDALIEIFLSADSQFFTADT
jgi:hypothetical protein